ncbi:MAG: hypothetical protein H6825_02560, partial [Planctomycetes bacterium]|nr:hypothetical protein [Planctomycetota bacterium]
VAGERLAVDRGPSGVHTSEEILVTDESGRLALPRHLSRTALALASPGLGIVDERVDGLPPRTFDGWAELPGDAREFVLHVDSPGRVRGVALDALHGEPVDDGLARLLAPGDDGNWRTVDTTRLRADGTFELRCEPSFKGWTLTVQLDAPGFASLEAPVFVEPAIDAWDEPLPFVLAKVPGALTIEIGFAGSASWRLARGFPAEAPARDDVDDEASDGASRVANGARLRAWISTVPGILGREGDALPESYRLVRDEWVSTQAPLTLRTMEPSDHWLALLLEQVDDAGTPRYATWGPRTIGDAAQSRVHLVPRPPRSIEVDVTGLREDRRYFLGRTTWHPWVDDALSDYVWVSDGGRTERTLDVPLAGGASTFLDLRLDRGPVSASLASLLDWLPPFDALPERVRLAAPATYSVQGHVTWYTDADWPDTAVALLGEPVDEGRSDALGEHDWCTRPGKDGSYRFEDVPEGDYLFVLYRPAGDEGVEVLGQRPVSVRENLFQLEIWPETESSRGRIVIAR